MQMQPDPLRAQSTTRASVILPAHDEADYIGSCLEALLASRHVRLDVIVVANACSDATAKIARSFSDIGQNKVTVIETEEAGKLNALNLGDAEAEHALRIYLDADVIVSPDLVAQLCAALRVDGPRYASGTPRISAAQSWVTRRYAGFWTTLPFVTEGVPGFGIFAMNREMRQRWGHWPDIISDDTFARLQALPEERVRVRATYSWPMIEGFRSLVRVRRRQNAGVEQIARTYPALVAHDDTPAPSATGLIGRLVRDPLGFAVYATVALAVKSPLFRTSDRWARGR